MQSTIAMNAAKVVTRSVRLKLALLTTTRSDCLKCKKVNLKEVHKVRNRWNL